MGPAVRTSDQAAILPRQHCDGLVVLGWGQRGVVPDKTFDELADRFRVRLSFDGQLDAFDGDFESSFRRR